jgi:hypothetical protein
VKTNPLRSVLGYTAAGVGIMALGLMVLLVLQWRENRWLRTENRRALLDIQAAREDAQRAQLDQAALRTQLATAGAESEALKQRLQAAETAASKAAPAPAPTPQTPRAQQIKVFVGREFAGYAWMLPGTTGRESNPGGAVTEPVVLMDESARRAFTIYRTNWVEREVMSYNTVNYNYDPYPHGVTYWVEPAWGHRPTNRPPVSAWTPPGNTQPRPPLRPPVTPPGGSPWTPVTFDNVQNNTPSVEPLPPHNRVGGTPTLNLVRPQPVTVYPRPGTGAGTPAWGTPDDPRQFPAAASKKP